MEIDLTFELYNVYMTELNHEEAFEVIVDRAKEELGDSLKNLFLYGSVAAGNHSRGSDLDVFAVVEDFEDKRWLEKTAAEIGVEYGVLVSAIVKTEVEYKDMQNSSFAEEVRETGKAYV